ncbi:MAG: sulfatase-like hydrolase/transferase [Thermoleophilales bacterium]|nr:sulfatase-like hydrolase/transferase [Thermoleophilales bacterium]
MSITGESPEAEPKRGLSAVLDREPPTRRQLLLGGGHIAALWALAFVQPLLDLLGRNPDFFVARGNTTGDILILAIGFTLVPPLVLLGIEWVISKVGTKAYYGLHLVLMGLIATFFFIPLVSDVFSARSLVILVVSLGAGAFLAWMVFRYVFVKNLMDILIIAPIVILAMFVFNSKTTELIFPDEGHFEVATDSGNNTPVVLMIYDELGTSNLMTSKGRIDAGRYPNFARLAASSTWYKNETTTAFFTPHAVPGILTGINQPADTLPTWQEQPLSIFSQFSRGRQLHVLEPVTALCPDELCPDLINEEQSQKSRLEDLYSDLKYVEGRLVLPPGIADTLPDVSSNFEGFGDNGGEDDPVKLGKRKHKRGELAVKAEARSDPELYEQFIQQIPDSDRGLTVMHMHLPHQVWKYDLQGNQYNESPIEQLSHSLGNWMVNSNGISVSQSRMYVQTGFADNLLGQMRRKLESMGLWNKALVIVTADHGISFEGNGVPQRQADKRAMGEVANPPLFIKYPGQRRGVVSPKHSMTLDIVPTIARTLGVNDLYKTDGVPLQGPVPKRDVTITDPEGNLFTVGLGEMIQQRRAAIRRADQRLGTGPFYTLGPAPELIGRKVDPVPKSANHVQLDEPDLGKAYDPGEDLIPMFITGTWDGNVPAAPRKAPVFAIAVNGKVQATARPFDFDGSVHWGALVNPRSLHPGKNRIGVYRLAKGRLMKPHLVPLGGNQG